MIPFRPGPPGRGSGRGRRRRCGRGAGARREHGQTTIEFALVLPFVALLIVGLAEVARLGALQVAAVDAARAGARAASVDPRPAVARQAAADAASGASLTVTTAIDDGAPSLVTVRVTRTVALLPGLGWSAVELQASSTMAVESPG